MKDQKVGTLLDMIKNLRNQIVLLTTENRILKEQLANEAQKPRPAETK